MEKIITNPGLQHLAEKIFWNLDIENLKICGLINQSCLHMLDNPMLWLRKFVGLSKANQKDWIKIIQSEKNPEKKGQIIAYLQWNLKKFVKDNGIARKNPTNKLVYEDDKMGNFCMGDVGGYGIADYLPRVPFLPKGPVGPAGKKGTRGR